MNTKWRTLVSVLLGTLWIGMSVGASYHFHLDGAYHNDCSECNFQKNLFSADLHQTVSVPIHYISIQQIVEAAPKVSVFLFKLSFFIRPPPKSNY